MRTPICFFILLLWTCTSLAQNDSFSGFWQSRQMADGDAAAIDISFHIGRPENGLLYPAQMNISSGSFSATYNLLLVKKDAGQLAIGRTKFPVQETPFSLGTWTITLNGSLSLSTDENGKTSLLVNRIAAKRYGFAMPQLTQYADSTRSTAIALSHFLKDTAIRFTKILDEPWRNSATETILHTYRAPAYFGLIDTLNTSSATATINFTENYKADNDSVSVLLNGKRVIDRMDINHPQSLDITLDTGLNILAFFAENYGSVPPNTGKMNIVFAEKKYTLDFASRENMSATFIVAKIYYYPSGKRNDADMDARKKIIEKINVRKTVRIDSIRAIMPEITLAIWDDAVEDGDSISLQINEEIYMPGIAVKKKPQFIQVKLYPGDNQIIFIADNLGAISPNTSVLEIIDGKRRKSYMINTNLGQNNSIKILYNPGQ